MTTYLALLRGINVGGHKKILMADLRELFEDKGFTNVKSYIQSGNVVFNSELESETDLTDKIEKMIEDEFGFQVPVRVRTAVQMQEVIEKLPFTGSDYLDEASKIAITFFDREPAESKILELEKYVFAPEQLIVCGREAFSHCPGGFARTKLTNGLIEKKLGVSATSRNLKTFMKMMAMLG